MAFRGLTSIEACGEELSVQIDADGRSWALMVDLLQRYDLSAQWDDDVLDSSNIHDEKPVSRKNVFRRPV